MPSCLPCPLAVTLQFNSTTCESQASTSSYLTSIYLTIAVAFSCIGVASAVVAVRLMRARHIFSLRAVHFGVCLYVSMFVPYAALQAATLGQLATLNNQGANSLARASAQISTSATFAAFFSLGFAGKVTLLQMWVHIARLHSNCSSETPRWLQSTLTSTYKAFVWVVAATVVLYLIGFAVLSSNFMASTSKCAQLQDNSCLNSTQALQQPCKQIIEWMSILKYYEGAWAAIVLLIFTVLSFLFNGVVFAMYARAVTESHAVVARMFVCLMRSRLTEERVLSPLQLMMVHSKILRCLARPLLPKGWTAGSFKTSGEVNEQRVALRTLGGRLAAVSILSFLCKSASVAISYLARDSIEKSQQLESIIFLVTTLAVQAVPSTLTLLLLHRFYFSRSSGGRGTFMQSLLTHEGVPVAGSSDSPIAAAQRDHFATEHLADENARLHAEVRRLQAENSQLRLDMARKSQQVKPPCAECVRLLALTLCRSCRSSSFTNHKS